MDYVIVKKIEQMESVVKIGRNDMTTILLICQDGKSRQMYQSEIIIPGVTLICVSSLVEFFSRNVYCPLNGILVDMPTYIRSNDEEKRLLTELVAVFPALRLKCQETSGEIRTLPFGTAYPGNTPPAVFVQKYCSSYTQRRLRTGERSLHNMPVLLHHARPNENTSGAKSVTANIASRGCFLINVEPWSAGDQGWLVFPDLKDNSPVLAEVCWVRAWGESRALPGMGVRFIHITESQRIELRHFGGQIFMQEEE